MTSREVHVPTVNIASLMTTSGESFSEEDRAATSSALVRACETHGLFFVVGHGITTSQRRLAFDNARRFFSLPEAAKRKIPAKKGGFTRGYIGFGGESGSHLRECKEAFSYGYPWPNDQPPNNALQGPNIWPDSDSLGEGWRDSMSALFRFMVSVNEAVARGLSLSLDLGLQGLPALCHGGDTISLLRLFHYFPYSNDAASSSSSSSASGSGSYSGSGTGNGTCKNDDDNGSAKTVASTGSSTGSRSCGKDGTGNSGGSSGSREGSGAGNIGSSPHTDWGLSTTILQDGSGGLQFLEQATQRWVDVPCAQEDALVFNCGDYLSLLSNGRLKSPVHQVVTTGVERTSFVFFYYPSFDATLPVTAPRDDASSSAGATSTNPAAAAVTATAAATEEPVAREPRETIGPYNTLLDLRDKQRDGDAAAASAVDEDDASFGQYLLRKWGAVFREK